jgi:hypothetical protein
MVDMLKKRNARSWTIEDVVFWRGTGSLCVTLRRLVIHVSQWILTCCTINDLFSFGVYELFNFKNVFIDKHGLLSGIGIVPYSNPNVNGWGLYHGTVCDCGVIAKTPYQMSIMFLWYKTYTPRAKQTRPSDS